MVFHMEHITHMMCETEKFMNILPRQPQQDFIMPPNIKLHTHTHTHTHTRTHTHPQLLQNFLLNVFSSDLQKPRSMSDNVHDAVYSAFHY